MDVPWEVWPHAVSVIVVVRVRVWGVGGQTMVTDTPKDLLVACRETNLRESHEMLFNQASNANGTEHARVDFMSSPSTFQPWNPGDFDPLNV